MTIINTLIAKQKLKALQQALIDGENSGKSTPLDIQEIIAKAKRKARLLPSRN